MSRICVKNLPWYLTDERLREHFSAKGEVTDAKIIRTSDGSSRQFGFVGFRTDEEAQAAVDYFDRSFLDTSRLTCELAWAIGDSHLSRPWSRYSEGSSAHQKVIANETQNEEVIAKKGVKKGKESDTKEKQKRTKKTGEGRDDLANEDDPLLEEFLEVMLPSSKRKVWANDTGEAPVAGPGRVQAEKSGKKRKGDMPEEDGKPRKQKKKVEVNPHENGKKFKQAESDEDSFDQSDDESEELYDNELQEDEDEEGVVQLASNKRSINDDVLSDEKNDEEEGVVHDEAVSDMDYLKKRVKHNWEEEHEDEEEGAEGEEEDEEGGEVEDVKHSEDEESEELAEKTEEGVVDEEERDEDEREDTQYGDEEEAGPREVDAEAQEGVAETGRLFVRNLCYTASEDDLRELFARYGELSEVHLVVDKETRRSKGFAYVLFMLPENAVKAMRELDLSIFQGRLLHILPAHRPPPPPEDRGKDKLKGPGMSQYKQEREEQRKANELSGGTQAWSSLFMRPDTVAENVAQKYGIEKRELLNPEANDLAVRLALGETHIVAETKRILQTEGVNVEELESFAAHGSSRSNKERSDRVILVKNLPFSAGEADLIGMFGKFGGLGRVILPSTKTLALVEYMEAADARRGFKGLAYKRFQHVPLYLEWAPKGIFVEGHSKPIRNEGKGAVVVDEGQVRRMEAMEGLAGEDEGEAAEARSLFVKNLNFRTTEKELRAHIEKVVESGTLRSVVIKKKKAANGKELSMGFGFAEFSSIESAKAARKQLQGTVLDGHALVCQLSHGRQAAAPHAEEGKKAAKKTEGSSTKIIVRNVAFEATKKDIRQLFDPFGQIKSMRLPKKFDGSHRGFAFIEFVTRQEAQNAFNALQSTHLYGRHLVLERAKEGEGLEELRARTAAHYYEDGAGRGGGRKQLSELVDDAQQDLEDLMGR